MLAGILVFADEPKGAARQSLTELAALGIELKIATGDNAQVAEKVCHELGLESKGTSPALSSAAWTMTSSPKLQ